MKSSVPKKNSVCVRQPRKPLPERLTGKAIQKFRWQWLDVLPVTNPIRQENPTPEGCRVMGLIWKDGSTVTVTFPEFISSKAVWRRWCYEDTETAYGFARAVLERDWGKQK